MSNERLVVYKNFHPIFIHLKISEIEVVLDYYILS